MERRSVWLATAKLPIFSALNADLEVDLAVVGGGIVGLTTALLAQQEGARVAVLEGARIGAGTTGYTTGKVTSQHSLIYADLLDRHGEDLARRYADANQAGVEKVAELATEYDIDCELTRAPAFAYTRSADQRSRIEAEVEAAKQLGLPGSLTTDVGLPFSVEGAVRFDDQLHFHAGKYLAGLARAFIASGGQVYDATRVTEIEDQLDQTVRLTTESGAVRAAQVVVATLLPPGLTGGYFAKTRPSRSYALAARLAGEPPPGMTISVDQPGRSTRPWGDHGLIIVGNGHEVGAEPDTEGRYRDLEDWARSTFDVESVEYRWSAQDYATPDHLPYVGRSPLSFLTLVATGFQKWGLSNGTAAAIMLSDLMSARENPWLPAFDATRIGDAKAVGKLIVDNTKVGSEFVGGRLHRDVVPAEQLAPGEGGVVEIDGKKVGGYRDAAGVLHAVGLTCTHLGCPLHWNPGDISWDCRCHGSRFDVDGSIVNGPAVKPLEVHEVTNTPPS